MNITLVLTRSYERKSQSKTVENKANQSRTKPISPVFFDFFICLRDLRIIISGVSEFFRSRAI